MTSRHLSVNPCSVLFLCGHNAGRSQMAAGWLRSMGGESVRVLSAGSSDPTNGKRPACQPRRLNVAAARSSGLARSNGAHQVLR